MKGAVIVTRHPQFVNNAASTLRQIGYDVSLKADALQLSDNGRLLTLHGGTHSLKEMVPNVDAMKNRELLGDNSWAFLVDCRWEDLFCRVMKDLAQTADDPFFIIDNGDIVLSPGELDPARVHL
jgi:hypothetical protein